MWILSCADGPGAVLCIHPEQGTTRLQPSRWRLRGGLARCRHLGGGGGGRGYRGLGGGCGRCRRGIGRIVVYEYGGDGIKERCVCDGGPCFPMWPPVAVDEINAPPYWGRWRSPVVDGDELVVRVAKNGADTGNGAKAGMLRGTS